jgi:hypothetical protein
LCGPGGPLAKEPAEGDLSVDERLLASVIEACDAVSAALEALPE